MDVSGGRDNENQNIHMWSKHGGLNQQWDVVYVKEMKAAPKPGSWDKEYGFRIGVPFYISTALPSARVMDLSGRNIVIKRKTGASSQQWFFDWKTKTVKNNRQKGWSFDIQNAGRTNNLQAWNTNSGWF
jgi:hypothetical protein